MKLPAALALACALALPAAPLPAQQSAPLPALGDAGLMGSAEERRLGDEIARSIYRDPDWLDDAILGEYVDGICDFKQLIIFSHFIATVYIIHLIEQVIILSIIRNFLEYASHIAQYPVFNVRNSIHREITLIPQMT